ncbi:hypothetical protein [Polluticaenibacter yanchengensis]|uniref:Uncharacterized protein n=1 Tax=Polluticaenibacter yanchengensis TaxID=3014562 RepID=A0ABT4UKJ9_9BACT|nr:hypothetical protein [Chitinophagaceae bacterium LY-5]
MKKVILSTGLSLVALFGFAEKNSSVNTNASSNTAINIQAVLEENMQLKLEKENLNNQVEELSAQVRFSNLMSKLNFKLQKEELQNESENAVYLKNYNRLMLNTILNLSK